jgi:hypothetical protein
MSLVVKLEDDLGERRRVILHGVISTTKTRNFHPELHRSLWEDSF